MAIRVTAWGIHVPNTRIEELDDDSGLGPACQPERVGELLGRKGLLAKEPATRLALCAVHRALRLPPAGPRRERPPDPRTAVVASSNLGNVATVQRTVQTLRTQGLRSVSALDAPNVSSNVLASSVAIWFGLGGPNLMVCSGETSGLDAVALASTLLRAGRADRAIVVGAEPDDDIAQAVRAQRSGVMSGMGGPLRAGAAAVVLERESAVSTAPILGRVQTRTARACLPDATNVGLVVGPADQAKLPVPVIDLVWRIGDLYGALGVLQVAVAAKLVAAAPFDRCVAVLCGNPGDGWRSVVLHPGRADRQPALSGTVAAA